jgi:hypothetical protein
MESKEGTRTSQVLYLKRYESEKKRTRERRKRTVSDRPIKTIKGSRS